MRQKPQTETLPQTRLFTGSGERNANTCMAIALIPLGSIFSPFCFGTRNSQHVTVRSGYLWLQQCPRSLVLVKRHHTQATLYKKWRRHRHGIWSTSDTTLKWCDHCYRLCPKSRILAHTELGTAMAKQLGIAGESIPLLAAAELMQLPTHLTDL